MSINWSWKEKCGEAVVKDFGTGKEFTKSLYEGNCFLIFLSEWKEDDKDMYSLYSFFADEKHAKICLGLTKSTDGTTSNMFVDGWHRLTKIRLNKKKCRNYKKIVTLFAQAFDNIEIEIFSEE